MLEKAQKGSDDLLSLVGNILDLSKLEASKMEVQEETVLLYPIVHRIVANFESYSKSEQLKFQFHYNITKNLQISIDKNKLKVILNNLLSNAFKYTQKGGGIDLYIEDLGDQLLFKVKDSGRGIHPKDVPHIFERYYQSNYDAQLDGGTGIGLALCREFTLLLGGQIEVVSDYGQGSEFEVRLPKKESSHPKQTPQESVLPTITDSSIQPTIPLVSTSQKNQTFQLLVIEDNASLRDYMQTILTPSYHVLSANNGLTALSLLSDAYIDKNARLPDLIITDLMMPEMDGYQLLKVLKGRDYFRYIPVIVLTARAAKEDKLSLLRQGIDDYIVKPFEEEELLYRVENLLNNLQERAHFLALDNPSSIKEEAPVLLSEEDTQWLKSFEELVQNNMKNSLLSVPLLASELSMSERSLQRQLKKLTGFTPYKYLIEIKLNKARELLEEKKFNTITRIAYEAGFTDVRTFNRRFKDRFGKRPSAINKS